MALRIAAIPGGDREVVIVVDMAGSTGQVGVPPGERKSRDAVIEIRRIPTGRGMTVAAISGGERCASRRVGRIIGLLPGGQVALRVPAIVERDLQMVIASNMALLARHIGMALRQRETDRRRSVINRRRAQPSVEALMALLAFARRECRWRGSMRGRGCVLPILHVTRLAGRRKPHEISDSGPGMALVALHNRVRAEQREAIEMVVDGLHRYVPTIDRVALGAVSSHLAAVNVGVAVGAVFADIGEDRFQVAAGAGNFFVHAAQRVASRVVIEFRNCADGRPTRGCVAVFARNIQRPVRTPGRLPLRRD